MSFVTTNPQNGQILGVHHYLQYEESLAILRLGANEQKAWRLISLDQRKEVLLQIAKALLQSQDELAKIVHLEVGKQIHEAKAEIEKCAFAFSVFANTDPHHFEGSHIKTDYQFSYSHLNPLGQILAIMPWNYPYWQLTRVLAPALLIGNSVVVKPSELTVGSNQKFVEIIQQVLPVQVVQTLMIDHKTIERLICLPQISAVTLTGSSSAGKKVARLCGENLKKCVLELGGSDAYVVFRDAKLDRAVADCLQARLVNYGQSCIAGKRFFIADEVYQSFLEKLLSHLSGIETRYLAHKKFQSQIQEQVDHLRNIGGRVLMGGQLPSGVDASYPITVIEFTEYQSAIGIEEIFGPVFILIRFTDEEEVFQSVNDTPYGLGAALFTERTKQAQVWAKEKLDVGMVAINDQLKSDPRLPFGGVKESGFGRELSLLSLYEFANVQTIVGRD